MTVPRWFVATPRWFIELLAKHKRIAIAGGPKHGKTTLTSYVKDRPVLHTDDYMKFAWSEIPMMLIRDANKYPSVIIEGVQVGRCLRKGMKVDAVVWLTEPCAEQTDAQASFTTGCNTVMKEWSAAARDWDVTAIERGYIVAKPFQNGT